MTQQLDLSTLIRNSNYIYHQSVIQGIKSSYGPGDSLELYFPKGPYILNVGQTQLWNRYVVKTDQPNSCPLYNDQKAMYNITSIQADGLDIAPNQGTRSRPVFNSIIDRFVNYTPKSDDPRKQQMHDVEFQFKSSGVGSAASQINTHMLTQDDLVPIISGGSVIFNTGDSQFQDFLTPTYRQVYRRRLNQLLRYGQFAVTGIPADLAHVAGSTFTYNQNIDPNVDSTTYRAGVPVPVVLGADGQPASGGGNPLNSEGQTWQCLTLGDISIECASMNQLYMGQFNDGLRISIRLVEPKYSMSCILPRLPHVNAGVNVDVNFNFSQQTSYRLTDVFIAQRNHYLTLEGVAIMNKLSAGQPVPYITYQYQLVPLTNANTLNYRNSLNSLGLLGVMIAHTGKGPQFGQLIQPNGVDYRGVTIWREPVNQYNSDHFYLETSNAQVTVGQEVFKQNRPFVNGNDSYASYLTNIDSSGVIMPGKIYSSSMYEYIDRQAVIFLPTNSIGGSGINVKGENIEVNLQYNQPQSTGKYLANHDAHIFYLITSSMRCDKSKAMQMFSDVLARQAMQQAKEQQVEEVASVVNSIDNMVQFYSDLKATNLHSNGEHQLLDSIKNNIDNTIKVANQQHIDIPGTIQNFIKKQDENQVFDNISHIKNDVRKTIFAGIV